MGRRKAGNFRRGGRVGRLFEHVVDKRIEALDFSGGDFSEDLKSFFFASGGQLSPNVGAWRCLILVDADLVKQLVHRLRERHLGTRIGHGCVTESDKVKEKETFNNLTGKKIPEKK